MICLSCNGEFTPKHFRQKKYCDPKCAQRLYKKKYRQGEYRQRRLEYERKYRAKNPERSKIGCRNYREKNLEKERQRLRDYQKQNLHLFRHNEAKRRAIKQSATPKWLSKEHLEQIKNIYKNCPEGYQVDHIIPLKNDKICGLHVPWNLQYLTQFENGSKHNKFDL